LKREKRGRMIELPRGEECFTLGYQGLDGVLRRSVVNCEAHPSSTFRRALEFPVSLPTHGETSFSFTIRCESGDGIAADGSVATNGSAMAITYDQALEEATAALEAARTDRQDIMTSSTQCNELLQRSSADLTMMMTATPHGVYPYAGVPWFNTPFGRDGIITALSMLLVDPNPARGVLQSLAAYQATSTNADQEAQPGKILHEARSGEMAALHEIPFGRYYGSVDSTPLFLMLAGAYYARTGDLELIDSLWGNIEAALGWIDGYGDLDGDGFIEYFRMGPRGLVHQGWKDSNDSVFHSDGALAEGPIALCEVQGYVYAAKREAAILARALGRADQAAALKRESEKMRKQFEERFWCEKLGTYALALDGEKRQCEVRTSNAGHALFVGIASPKRALRTAQTLLGKSMFSGWGIRTLAQDEARYNPMSYHNGSVWPHDNALIAAGLARYGFKEEAMTILEALTDASGYFELYRLPELFCGFPRRTGESPTLYPVACAPQSWAAAAIFLLLQSCLGVSISAADHEVRIVHPVLPESLSEVRFLGLRVGEATADLLFRRLPDSPDVAVSILRREGNVRVMTLR
jgi:glycogen debranching enzyme